MNAKAPFAGMPAEDLEKKLGDHTGRQQNHIWNVAEIEEIRQNIYKHKPQTFSDKIVNRAMYGLYHVFNFMTGYKAVNPSVKSIEWRLVRVLFWFTRT